MSIYQNGSRYAENYGIFKFQFKKVFNLCIILTVTINGYFTSPIYVMVKGNGHDQRPAISFAHSFEKKYDMDDVVIALGGHPFST